jgi:hypothetical protein
MAGFKHRLARLEQKAPPPPPPPDQEHRKRIDRAFARLDRVVEAALDLMSEEEGARVIQAAAQWGADGSGPLGGWFTHLAEGKSWLPEVPPEVMRALLLAWISPECDGQGRVCVRCGLEYPCHKTPPLSQWKVLPGKVPLQGPPPWYDLPDFFAACPGCGASMKEIDWPWLVAPNTYPWQQDG